MKTKKPRYERVEKLGGKLYEMSGIKWQVEDEDGNMFIQVVCVSESGKVVQDEAIGYKY